MVSDPDYDGASIGVMCLFAEQVSLVNEMVAATIDPIEWEEHDIVVLNPDGFQGDERDVILYSLSWDNDVMDRRALAARQADSDQVQGCRTWPSQGLATRSTSSTPRRSTPSTWPAVTPGRSGPGSNTVPGSRLTAANGCPPGAGKVDSQFEADVAEALRARGIEVRHQYPACGLSIDLVCELDGVHLAVECDGELYHLDEHGELRIEDLSARRS